MIAHKTESRGFLSRLAKDTRGSTLAIMAAVLIPLAAFSGSAIDMARLYVVKVRLQQACDAGALAGRKFMTDTNPNTPLEDNAVKQAGAFFDNNFHSGWFSTTGATKVYSKTTDSQVAGNASVTVPMTIMAMFGQPSKLLTVTCEARYDVADSDIMFVLDTTGSMSCMPTDSTSCSTTAIAYTRPDGTPDWYNPEKSGSKLQAVRDAVVQFYNTLAANSDPTTHIRYGFVPYTSVVNAGAAVYALSPSYFVNSWNYQSREVYQDYSISYSTTTNSSIKTQANCDALDGRSPATAKTYNAQGTATQTDATWVTPNNGAAYCSVKTTKLGPRWLYKQETFPTTNYLASMGGTAVPDPSKVDSSTSKWIGCVEERTTTPGLNDVSDYDITNLPPDLDPDLIPSSTNPNTQWRPLWPDVEYLRSGTPAYTNGDDETNARNFNKDSLKSSGYQSCGAPVSVLKTMALADVQTYLNGLKPHGGTYHDTGMIWGTRMLSPDGIFSSYTQAWPGRQPPNRVIVFLTDGAMSTNTQIYGQYGIEQFDKRVRGNNTDNLDNYHNARFLTECAKAKSKNMSVWVVAVGQSLTTPLQQCATNNSQALYAGTGADLTSAFVTIAKQVAMLRISK